jgi:hypothetical protein
VVTALHAPLDSEYPVLQTVHTVADVQVLQLLEQALHAPVFTKYPLIHDVQLTLEPDLIQVKQFDITHCEHNEVEFR